MRHARVYGIAGLAVLAIAAVAFAQTTVTPLPDNAPVQTAPIDVTAVSELAKAKPGDATAGAAKAGTCAACHALDGNGTDPALYPRLAGQSERYVAHQLALFKSGERVNAIMLGEADVDYDTMLMQLDSATGEYGDAGGHTAAAKLRGALVGRVGLAPTTRPR